MKPLEPPDCHRLQAAKGWLELGNFEEAHTELDNITPDLHAHPDILNQRFCIYYYVRVTQADCDEHGNLSRAWSSPIWVSKP